ncbi:MAG: hypothetical protein IJ057_02365 [Bacteroidales bacterium]|nr:hypothetical protein [Bacteroidales bacterium]
MKNERNDWKYYNYRNAWRFAGPPHEEQKLNDEACKNLLRMSGLMVRNTYDFDCKEETCFWNLIKDQFGGLKELTSNTRNRVTKSLECLDFQRVDFSMVQTLGYPILKATFDDYATVDRPMNQQIFEDYLRHCQCWDYEYWGVFDKNTNEFIGFCANRLWENATEYGIIGIWPQYKHNGTFPYYGLFYEMNRYYLQEKSFRYVTDGSRSITEHSNIQQFLEEKFRFRKAYCQLAVHYKWWMKIAVNSLYPFRKIITLPRVKAILNMEAMQRGEK